MKIKQLLLSKILFLISSIIFILSLCKLINIEPLIIFLSIVILIFINIYLILTYIYYKKNKKYKNIIKNIILIIISGGMLFSSLQINKLFKTLHTTTSKNIEKYILVSKEQKDKNNIQGKKIYYDKDIPLLEKFKDKYKDNEFVTDTYDNIVKKLNSNIISYAILPSTYKTEFTDLNSNFIKEIWSVEKSTVVKKKDLKVDKPFTILLSGVDGNVNNTNPDVIILATFNPKTMNITLTSVPRDTKINENINRKINYYKNKALINQLEEAFGIKIDYYATVDFSFVVKIVDLLGGLNINVPSPICEQDSSRRFGKYVVTVESGDQHLNGEQVLALARHRKNHSYELDKYCSPLGKKYNSAPVNDFTRNAMQQKIIEALLHKAKTVRNFDTIQNVLKEVLDHVHTNVKINTVLNLYNLVSNGNTSFHIEKIKINGYDSWENYYFFIPYKTSIYNAKNRMLINLEQRKHPTDYNFKFDPITLGITNTNDIDINSKTMPNFINKNKKDVENFFKKWNKIKINYHYISNKQDTDTVLNQSIEEGTPLSKVYNVTISISRKNTKVLDCTDNNSKKCLIPKFHKKKDVDDWENNVFSGLDISYMDHDGKEISSKSIAKNTNIRLQSIKDGTLIKNIKNKQLILKI